MEDIDEVEEVLARIPPTPTPTAPRERPPNSNSSVNPGPDPMEVSVREEEEVKTFMNTTCRCQLHRGEPCSNQFGLTNVMKTRMESMELSRNELDMVLLGQIMACSNHSGGVVV